MDINLRNFNKQAKSIFQILDEHLAWFYGIVAGNTAAPMPTGFEEWIKGEEERRETLASLYQSLKDMRVSDDLEEFAKLHGEFIRELRNAERQAVLAMEAREPVTGLGQPDLLARDYKIEMERLTRDGKQFCIALIAIDGFEDLKKEKDDVLQMLGATMKKSMRNFDEAYYIGENEFVMCLKQTDRAGAMAGLERLNRLLEEKGEGVTVSSCLSEPPPGEELPQLLEYLRHDLYSFHGDQKGVIVECHDISPLQRFVSEHKS